MERTNIYKLLSMLGINRYKNHAEWVTASCPFAQWTHFKKSDEHPSFGIHVGSMSKFHCFSCGKKGSIALLPTVLSYYSGVYLPEISEFIFSNDVTVLGDYEIVSNKIKSANALSEEILQKYDMPKPNIRCINKNSISLWGLRKDNNRLIIPIRDLNNRLIALKGRALNGGMPKYLLYTQYSKDDPKKFGIWYGSQFVLVQNKALFITEGEIDAILLKQFGVSNVWSSMGASITTAQMQVLSNITLPIILFNDKDLAGITARNKIIKAVRGLMDIYEIKNYYGCKDASELYEKNLLRKALKSLDKINQ